VAGDALQRLISAIEKHYEEPKAPPLLLSSFGQRNKQLLTELKDEFGSLKAAVHAAGEDRIRLVDTTIGRETVAPAGIAAELQLQIQGEIANQRQAANLFGSLPVPVQIAFCVRTESGEYIAIDIVRPFRFAKVTAPDLIRPTQRIILDTYRRPGLLLRAASVHVFRQGEASTALGRLIAAQPADIIPRLVIPADIAQILLKHS